VVVGGEPKTLLCWVWPQHREASDECLACHSPREDIGASRLVEGSAGDGLHRSGVNEAEGAKVQGGPRSQRDPATVHPIR
jgi:hypothetical protein